jgi:hypothetical protein
MEAKELGDMRQTVHGKNVHHFVYPNVAKVEDTPGPRRPRVRLYEGTPNPWQRRRWGVLGFPEG